MHKPLAVLALTTLAAAVVAFGNPAPVQAANQNQPAATKPTEEQCAPISKRPYKQVLDWASQEDQRAALGKLLNPNDIQQCPVTVPYQELRGAIDGAQKNSLLVGGAIGAVGVVAGFGVTAALVGVAVVLGSGRPSR